MTIESTNAFAPYTGGIIPQFSPNFTVFQLSPDTLCLYSEDRKFLLYGQVYCTLAAVIAEGGVSFDEIVSGLEPHFPREHIHEALQRLIARRYIVAESGRLKGTAAAYWASLGMTPEAAEKNLHDCRVRVQAFDVQGEQELSDALSELGVRVVKRSGDMTVALVSDYLDEQLDDVNRKHLSSGAPWVLAQPSGIFPLVGPILRPRSGPCWMCLAERMRRNREVKAMLGGNGEARCLRLSPLVRQTVGQSGIQLSANEIGKAIATGFRTDLNQHIVSQDLLGAAMVKHYVPMRPQCPVCGKDELHNPARAPVPLELQAGGKPVMTSGGYRSVASRATVARYRKHVSPLTGVVTRLERVEVDLPLNATYAAAHSFSAPAKTVNELRSNLNSYSFGKGSTGEQGEASALMEAIERYSGVYQGDEIRAPRRLVDFDAGEAIHPNDMLLYSKTQIEQSSAPVPGPDDEPMSAVLFDEKTEVDWSPVWSLSAKRFKYLPASLLYFNYRGLPGFQADSNGCAAGNTVEEAIVQGFLELVERDAYALWWYNRVARPEVDLNKFDDSYVHDLRNQLGETGRRLWVLDITSDLGIPSFVAVAHWLKDGNEYIDFGSGSHFDSRIAMLRALTELNQFMSLGMVHEEARMQWSLDGNVPLRLEDFPYLSPGKGPAVESAFDPDFGHLEPREQVKACVRTVEKAGLDFLVLNQTRPDIEVPVVRVIVPGLRHFYRRYAPGRLYDVPVQLGWLKKPVKEENVNPIFPHT